MLKNLLFPLAAAAGAAVTDMGLSRLPIPRGVGPSGPVPLSPLVRWGMPIGVLALGTWGAKKVSGGVGRGLLAGVAINGALHLFGNISDSVDVNYGGNY